MSNERRNERRGHLAGAMAMATTALTVAAFVAPSGQAAFAAGTTTTSSTTTISTTTTTGNNYNCAASVDETALSRSGWAASANAPSSGSDAPSYALDGNLGTRFSTNEDQVAGLYFEVDLGASQSFGELQMEVPNSKSDYARSYTIEDSENGISWSSVASCEGTSDSETVSWPVQTARYVRVVLIGAAQWWWSIDEFQLYGASSCSASVDGTPLSRAGWTAGSNAPLNASDPPAYALDANPGTRFATNKDQVAGLYYEVDMRSAFNFDEVYMATPNSPDDYARSYTIEVWTGSSWATVASCTGSNKYEVVSFPRQTARYIKVVLGSSANYWWSIDELDVYSSFSEPTSTTTTTSANRTSVAVSASANPGSIGTSVTYAASVSPKPTGGTVTFVENGMPIPGCTNVGVSVSSGEAICTTTYYSAGTFTVRAFYSGSGAYLSSSSGDYAETVRLPADGYWLATANGQVYGNGAAQSFGNVATSAVTGPVVGIAGTPTTKGYWVVTANGMVSAFGDAQFYGDLPDLGKHVKDIVAIAPTSNGQGYYLVGADGGFFTFGNAKFAGSLPGIHVHVHDVVGMVATPSGAGYLLVGADGGVFSFGQSHFYGSLPGIHKHVRDIRAILPSSAGTGYILVGADGGAFTFGSGVRFYGSLPGEGIRVGNVVGIALTPDNGGYYMAGSDGHVYTFGDAEAAPQPVGLSSNLPVAAIAGT